jgi:hypothetical protein
VLRARSSLPNPYWRPRRRIGPLLRRLPAFRGASHGRRRADFIDGVPRPTDPFAWPTAAVRITTRPRPQNRPRRRTALTPPRASSPHPCPSRILKFEATSPLPVCKRTLCFLQGYSQVRGLQRLTVQTRASSRARYWKATVRWRRVVPCGRPLSCRAFRRHLRPVVAQLGPSCKETARWTPVQRQPFDPRCIDQGSAFASTPARYADFDVDPTWCSPASES